ncbi:Fur family transcriptional regulator [Marinoscillum sp.]|uniref:Fur family transcriptional regulator n=1 Tax=Marinoscillum sp. TaxID=2024838 RepID=UPI003BAC6D5E
MIKQLEKNLKSHNIKPTAMRLLVLELLLDREAAVGLTELYRAFEKSDRTTLYRTLKVFEESGMVHSIDDGTGVPKYALCSDACDPGHHDDAHIHFHCDLCGKTYCLPKCRIPRFELPEKFSKSEVNLVVKGKCADCEE